MVHIDMTKPDRDLNAGVDLWEVSKSESAKSRGGDGKFALKLFRVSKPDDRIFDDIMLEGAGWSIGKVKLCAFVPPNFKGEVDPLDFVGRRLWVGTHVQTWEGKDRLKVDIEQLKYKGYQPADDVPDGCVAPAEGDAIPF